MISEYDELSDEEKEHLFKIIDKNRDLKSMLSDYFNPKIDYSFPSIKEEAFDTTIDNFISKKTNDINQMGVPSSFYADTKDLLRHNAYLKSSTRLANDLIEIQPLPPSTKIDYSMIDKNDRLDRSINEIQKNLYSKHEALVDIMNIKPKEVSSPNNFWYAENETTFMDVSPTPTKPYFPDDGCIDREMNDKEKAKLMKTINEYLDAQVILHNYSVQQEFAKLEIDGQVDNIVNVGPKDNYTLASDFNETPWYGYDGHRRNIPTNTWIHYCYTNKPDCFTIESSEITCASESSSNENDIHKIIQEYAYFLWEEAGKPDHSSEEFWIKAEKEIQDIIDTRDNLD